LKSCATGVPDLVVAEEVVDVDARDLLRLRAFADAGVTWYMDGLSTRALPLAAMFELIHKGPPRL